MSSVEQVNEAKAARDIVENIKAIARDIVENIESYRESLRKKSNKGEYNRLSNEEKRKVDETVETYNKKFIEGLLEVIKKEGLTQELVKDFAESGGYAQAIAGTITFNRTQLRKLFNQIRQMESEVKREKDMSKIEIKVAKLHAILAYTKGRKLIDENFYKLMDTMLMKVRESSDTGGFRNFVDIFESIVAYHVYYNPSN